MSSWQMFFFGGGKCLNLGVVNVRILGVVNVRLANNLTPLAVLVRLSICLPCSQSPCSPAKLHSCSTNCPASLHQASTVGSSRCPLCMNHNPFGVGSLGFHGSQGVRGKNLVIRAFCCQEGQLSACEGLQFTLSD